MNIKNTSSKVINIGSKVLLPDEEFTISEAAASTPAIAAFIKKGYISKVEAAKTESTTKKKTSKAKTETSTADVKTETKTETSTADTTSGK